MRQGAATLDVFIDIVVPVFGRIPARQNVPAGTFLDTLTVTIIF